MALDHNCTVEMDEQPGRSVMTFYPTLEEMQSFSNSVEFVESKGAHLAGIAKVHVSPRNVPDLIKAVPPEGFSLRKDHSSLPMS
jgi:hypothetical protein